MPNPYERETFKDRKLNISKQIGKELVVSFDDGEQIISISKNYGALFGK